MKTLSEKAEYMRAWRAKNRDKILAYERAWRAANKGKKAEYMRAWRAANRDKGCAAKSLEDKNK
jgi:hypothetical protein